MSMTVHAPLCYDRTIGDGIVAVCECDWETEVHDSKSGALAALGEHIANPEVSE